MACPAPRFGTGHDPDQEAGNQRGRATLCRPVAQVVGWPVIRCPRTESSNDFCDRNAKVCDAGQDGCPDL